MTIYGLLSDAGSGSNLSAKAKALVYADFPDAHVVDISHDLLQFNVQQAAYVLLDALPYFPDGSVHLVLMESRRTQYKRHLLALYRNQYILCADNGLLTYFEGADLAGAMEVTAFTDEVDDLRRLAKVATRLGQGGDPMELATPVSQWTSLLLPTVKQSDRQLIGEVIFIDGYGNLICNITQSMFADFTAGGAVTIYVNRFDSISQISVGIDNQPPATLLAHFTKTGYLRIAVKNDSAARLQGMRIGGRVIIEKR